MGRPSLLVHICTVGVSLLYGALLTWSGLELTSFGHWIIAALPTAASLCLLLWDVAVWRIPVLQKIHHRPYIAGLWNASIVPHQDAHIPDGGNRGPIPAFLEVRQTFWSTRVRLLTEESTSASTAVGWVRDQDAPVASLTYSFLNTPKSTLSHRSVRSVGAAGYDISHPRPQELEGAYYTDRYTKGDISCTLIDRTTDYTSFQTARQHSPKMSR